MVKINHITHKKSNVANKAPKATDIVNGEIAVNYADDTERMYIKNTSGKIIPFSADHIKINDMEARKRWNRCSSIETDNNIFLFNTIRKINGNS